MARKVLTNAEMIALINAGQKVTYKGKILRKVADVPSDSQILIDYPEYAYNRIEGNAKAILGYEITGSLAEGVVPKFDDTLKKWSLATVSGGGGGGSTLVIKEVDGTPNLSAATTLEVDQADGFVLSNPSGSIARLKLSNIPWSVLSKTGSSLADLTTRSASDLSSGTLPDARLSSNVTTAGSTIATDKLLGRDTAGTGAFEAIGLDGSLVFSGSQTIQLSGDSASPGNSKYYGTDGSGVKGFHSITTSGDVVGPSSATDNAIARFDTTTGKLIQNSLTTLDDSGGIHAATTIFANTSGGIQFGDSGGVAGATRGFIVTPSDGVFRFGDSAGGGNPHIILGSAGSSTGVRIKRNSTTLAVRNGDDTADASISASGGSFSGILSATSPRLSTGVADPNGNQILGLTHATSAVNSLAITNSATATAPNNYVSISSVGTDSSIPIRFIPKGAAYPNGGRVYFPVNTRFDDTGIQFWDTGGAVSGAGIGLKAGGSTFEITSINCALNVPREVMMLGKTVLTWGTTGVGPGDSSGNTANDEPPGRNTGIEKGARGVLGFVSFTNNTDTSYAGGTWRARANTPSQITTDQNNYDPGAPSYFLRLSSSTSVNITGLTFSDAPVSGQVHRIWNVGSNSIVLVNESASSTAANRFNCVGGSNITVAAGQCADLQYDADISRWRVFLAIPSAGGGSGTVNNGSQFQIGFYSNTGTTISGNTGITTNADNVLRVAPSARTSGNPTVPFVQFLTAADTGLSNVEQIAFQFGGDASQASVTRTFSGGGSAITNQRSFLLVPGTFAASSAQTITNAVGLDVSTPIAGANVTLTNSYAARFSASNAAHTPLALQGVSSQSGDYMRAINSSGTNVFRLDNSGNMYALSWFNRTATATRIEFGNSAHTITSLINGTAALTIGTDRSATFSGVLIAGSAPTTLTDSVGKILSAALNTVGVSQGGTGATTLTGVLKGNGTSAFTAAVSGTDFVAPGAITGSGLTVATSRLLGRSTASTGAVEEITVGSGLSLSGGTLTATGGGGSTNPTSGVVPYNNAGSFADTNLSFASNVLTSTRDSLGTTPADSVVLVNTTDAANNSQQISPSVRWSSKGWRTDATAASRVLDWRADLRPLQGTVNPANRLVFSQQVNAAGYTEHSIFGVAQDGTQYVYFPGGSEAGWPGLALGVNFGTQASPTVAGFYAVPGGSYLIARPAGGNGFGVHGDKLALLSGANVVWSNNGTSITTGTNDLFVGRNAAATLRIGAANAASPVAQTLTVQGARGGIDTNVSGTVFNILGSLGTGNAVPGRVSIQGGALSASSGTTGQSALDRHIVGATKVVSNNTTTAITNVTVANNTVAAGVVHYAVEVSDGTDIQIEVGTLHYKVTNKAGTIANNTVDKSGNQQSSTSGTLTVTFTLTAANPAVLQLNANSSLTPSTGFPRITYSLENLTQQAVAIQ